MNILTKEWEILVSTLRWITGCSIWVYLDKDLHLNMSIDSREPVNNNSTGQPDTFIQSDHCPCYSLSGNNYASKCYKPNFESLSRPCELSLSHKETLKWTKGAKIRNRYNQVPHLTQDTNEKVTNSQLDTTNESQVVSPFPAGDHKAHINRHAQTHVFSQ